MWWLLCREVLRMRNTIQRAQPWDVMVDLFLYRDPEQQDKDQEAIEPAFQRGPVFENPEEGSWAAPPQEWEQQQQAEWGNQTTAEWGNTATDVAASSWENTEQ